jgi:hypothetical protein
MRTRSTGTASISTTGRSSCQVTSCSASPMSDPDRASSRLRPSGAHPPERSHSFVMGHHSVFFETPLSYLPVVSWG